MLGTDVFGPDASTGGAEAALTTLLYVFCIIFAVNSAVHSYLIVKYSAGDKVSWLGWAGQGLAHMQVVLSAAHASAFPRSPSQNM